MNGMLVIFEILEEKGELVAVHDGALGVLVAIGYDWDMLRDGSTNPLHPPSANPMPGWK